MSIMMLYATFPSASAAKDAARLLLEERLIACANIHSGVASMYWWEGKICDASESVMIAKTRVERFEAAAARLRELHEYSCPCVVGWPLGGGYPPFLRWVEEETAGNVDG